MKNSQWQLVDYLKNQLETDKGVRALYLKGSLARKTDDAYSDVDFYCLVEETEYQRLLEKRMKILSGYHEMLYHSEVNFGEAQIIVLYDDNMHLDFYVTTKIPTEGVDDVLLIYDPQNCLEGYRRIKRDLNPDEQLEQLNELIYTLQEFYAAQMRGDVLWKMRLLSHMMTHISLYYADLYHEDHPVLHMKGVYQKLPSHLQREMDQIMELMIPEHAINCCLKIIDHCESIIASLSEERRRFIQMAYLNFMKVQMTQFI